VSEPATPSAIADDSTLPPRQVLLILTGLFFGMLLGGIDVSILSPALPTIAGSLHNVDQIAWIVTGYVLAQTATTPIFGKLGDLYGRKRLYLGSIVAFLLTSAACGLATSMTQLVLSRVAQGLAAGGLMVLSPAIIGDVVAPRQRARYQGYMAAMNSLSIMGGPALGGFIVEHLSWRWVFFVNLPVGLAALSISAAALPATGRRGSPSIDWQGSLLLMTGLSSLLLAATWGGRQYAWGSATIVGLVVLGLVALVLFTAQERRAPEPILPLTLFRNAVIRVTSAAAFLTSMMMLGFSVYLPFFFQLVLGTSPAGGGLLVAPMLAGMVVTTLMTGQIISRTGRYKKIPLIGTLVMALGAYLMSTIHIDTSRVVISAHMFVFGMGIGMSMQVLILAVQNAVPHHQLGVATSAGTLFRSLGSAVGTATFGIFVNHRFAHHLAAATEGVSIGPVRSPTQIRALPPGTREAAVNAFAHTLHELFLWMVPLAIAAFVVLLFLEERPLRTTIRTDDDQAVEAASAEAAAIPATPAPVVPARHT
jgi:EmrB/QacA subfamily drug resistance transporter